MMQQAKRLVPIIVILSVIAGAMAGFDSISENEYLKYAFQYMAFAELTAWLNRMLYVLAVSGIVFGIILLSIRYSFKKILLLVVSISAVAGLYFLIARFQLDYRTNLVWNEMSFAAKTSMILLLLIYVDLIFGKKWLGFLSGKMAWRVAAVFLAIPVLMNLSDWLWSSSLQNKLSDKPNIFIITVDALRADHVSGMGYHRKTTPFIDSLAAEGVLFTQAASNSNVTRSTVPSIFTGLYPSVHGILGPDGPVLSNKFVTLAEILKNQGYATHAYMPNGPLKRIFNFNQGFDVYNDRIMGMGKLERIDSAIRINESILKWADRNSGKKAFMYLHIVEPHSPYEPPPGYDRMFYDEETAAQNVRKINEKEFERMKRRSGVASTLAINDVNFYIAQYDAEIRYADDQIRYLFDNLRQRGFLDNALIFVTADHGEAFLEHGAWMHAGASLYDEVVHVPIVVHLPKADRKGLRLETPVLTFDIAATILDYLDITPDFTMQAKSLLPIIAGEVEAQWEYTFSECPEAKILRNREWKYMQRRGARENRKVLFNLLEDPTESNNLVEQNRKMAKKMRKKMRTIVKLNKKLSEGNVIEITELDENTIEQLRALGYIK